MQYIYDRYMTGISVNCRTEAAPYYSQSHQLSGQIADQSLAVSRVKGVTRHSRSPRVIYIYMREDIKVNNDQAIWSE